MALAVRIPSRRRIETHLFLLLVPAGILADRHDRPNFLLATHAVMALSALGLSLTITAGLVTPQILLVGTLVIGCGAALTMPAWQAAVSTLVEPGQIHSAAALNGMSFNFARAVGPALAGFIAQAATIATIFWINAVSFLGLILVFWRWRTGSARIRATKSEPPCEATAMGFSAMLSNSRFRSLLVRTFICFFGASSMWSLLPAFAALHLQMEAAEVGLLMGTLGVGAVLGGALLPRLKAKIGLNRLITVASTQLGLALLLAAWNGTSVAIWVSMLATGWGGLHCFQSQWICASHVPKIHPRPRYFGLPHGHVWRYDERQLLVGCAFCLQRRKHHLHRSGLDADPLAPPCIALAH